MKNHVNELTEGMQRLCAVANRIVNGEVSRIDVDLLMEDLRRLYEVALQMAETTPLHGNTENKEPSQDFRLAPEEREKEPETEEKMMAMVSTMAAMQSAPEPEPIPEPEPAPEPIPEPEPVPVAEPETEPEPVTIPRIEELEPNDNALLFDEVIIEPETPVVPKEPEIIEVPEIQEPPKAQSAPKKPAAQAVAQASLLDYLNQSTGRTLGESLGADRPQPGNLERKVDDLRTVININDKFSFMSELFHNNMKAYNDFIMHLNALQSREEALAHVHDVAQQQKWDDSSNTVQAFYKIFDKKF